jgi:hypothetical protein
MARATIVTKGKMITREKSRAVTLSTSFSPEGGAGGGCCASALFFLLQRSASPADLAFPTSALAQRLCRRRTARHRTAATMTLRLVPATVSRGLMGRSYRKLFIYKHK